MLYSISDLEKLSGIQAHTIRIWEQRYNALQPLRSAGNTRHYEDDQLKRLLNIVSLMGSGLKISQICNLSDEEMKGYIQQEIEVRIVETERYEPYISQLIQAGISYQEDAVNVLLQDCISKYSLKVTYEKIMYPALIRLGLLWQKDSICPAQEHFLSSLIRQKLFAVTDNLLPAKKASSTWLLFLPEDEGHDIGLLYAKYILRKAQEKTIYLGSHVPVSSLMDAVKKNKVDHLLFFLIRTRLNSDAQKYVDDLAKQFPESEIHLSGNTELIKELTLPPKMTFFNSIQALENMINKTKTSI